MIDVLVAFLALIFAILTFFAPIIALVLLLILKVPFKKAWFTTNWVLSALALIIVIPALIANHFEDKSYIKKLDAKYEVMEKEGLSEEPSTDKILAETYQTGSFRRSGRRSGNPLVNYIIKNYNDTTFKGTLTLKAYHNGEKMGENEFQIELGSGEGFTDYIRPQKLNINKKIWPHVEFEYTIEGSFSP